jgi:hypothetical protein
MLKPEAYFSMKQRSSFRSLDRRIYSCKWRNGWGAGGFLQKNDDLSNEPNLFRPDLSLWLYL